MHTCADCATGKIPDSGCSLPAHEFTEVDGARCWNCGAARPRDARVMCADRLVLPREMPTNDTTFARATVQCHCGHYGPIGTVTTPGCTNERCLFFIGPKRPQCERRDYAIAAATPGPCDDCGDPAELRIRWGTVLLCPACAGPLGRGVLAPKGARRLDCGHAPSAHGPHDTGYGTDSNGKTFCYDCAAQLDREMMIRDGRATLYLIDGSPSRVTNWPGSLSFLAYDVRTSSHGGGFGAQRTDAKFFGPDGFVWTATNRGDSQIARCRRTKVLA